MSQTCVGFVGILLDDKAPEAIRVNGRKYPGKQPIVYINGVLNDREDAISTAAEISVYYSAPVDAVWNPSSSFFLDIAQVAFVNKLNVPEVTTRTAVGYLRTRIAELPAGDHLEVIAHSQGGSGVLISSLISHGRRTKPHNLVTWGGAAYMQPEGMASVRNVINILDVLVPWPVGKGLTFEKNNDYRFFVSPPINHAATSYLQSQRFEDWIASPAGQRRLEERRKEMAQRNWSRR